MICGGGVQLIYNFHSDCIFHEPKTIQAMLGKASWSKIMSALQCVILSHLHALCVCTCMHVHVKEKVKEERDRE